MTAARRTFTTGAGRRYETDVLPDGRRVQRETPRDGVASYYVESASGIWRSVSKRDESMRRRIDAALAEPTAVQK